MPEKRFSSINVIFFAFYSIPGDKYRIAMKHSPFGKEIFVASYL